MLIKTQKSLIIDPCGRQLLFAALSLLCLLLLLPATAIALEPLLPQEQAFRTDHQPADADMVHLRWDIADGYYLYRDKFVFESLTPGIALGQTLFPGGEYKEDPTFGRMLVFRGQVDITIPIVRTDKNIETLRLKTMSQGCADRGVCYAPHSEEVLFSLPAPGTTTGQKDAGLFDKIGTLGQSLGQRLGLDRFSSNQGTFLPADQAYILSVDTPDAQTLLLRWDIAEGYYLYRDKIQVTALAPADLQLGELQSSPGKVKQDEYFGRMEVYYEQAEVTLAILRQDPANALPIKLDIAYQGCAEAGFCYPPVNKQLELTLPPARLSATPQTQTRNSQPLSEQDRIAELLGSDHALLTALSLFGIGLLLAFTPCVLPMIPILSSIIVGQGKNISTRRAFTLSLVYVLAMALTYTAAGVIAGLFGENLQITFQNPWVLITFSLVFIALALSMFGFYELQLPQRWQSRLNEMSNKQQQGKYIGVAIMGGLSALIVGPCIAAPLAGVLIYIGLSGDAWLGGFSLFMMSLGMGLPLLVIGTSAGRLLPRVGPWMTTIKAVFGVLLLGMAIWMLERILPGPVTLLLWAALLFGSAVNMGALARLEPEASGWQKLWKAGGLVLLIYGAILIIGAAAGGDDIFQPLKGLRNSSATNEHVSFTAVKGPASLKAAISNATRRDQVVMLDFYADWCIDCKKLEKATFTNPNVIQALSNVQLLQADVTANDVADQALLKQFGLFGPPAILFFDNQGREIKHRRLIGFLEADAFHAHIRATYP